MKNFYKFLLSVILPAILIDSGYTQIPTYTLTAKNFKTNCYNNQLEWDIFLKHTNFPVPFEMGGHQYFFRFDTSVSNGGTLTFQIVGSDLPQMFRPRNPRAIVYHDTTVLCLSSNTCAATGPCGADVTGNGNLNNGNGTLIVRVRLTTSTYFSFDNNPDFLEWRNRPYSGPITKINAYVNYMNTEITSQNNHFIDIPESEVPNSILINYPYKDEYGATPHPVIFKWNKYKCNLNNRYKLEVARDRQFTNMIFNDSNLTDTFKSVTGFIGYTDYYWRVSGFDFDSNKFTSVSQVVKFSTGRAISTEIKCLLEGIYDPQSSLLNTFPITLFLRKTYPPYNLVDSNNLNVNLPDFRIYLERPNVVSDYYYIVIKTINGIETWSRAGGVPVNFLTSINYYFTDSIHHAFGNNLKLKGNYYCIFSGDVNQDGMIELEDMMLIDNDAVNSVTGFNIPADLNYDEIVDLSDLSICENNAKDYVQSVKP